jgi:hypothetical protein
MSLAALSPATGQTGPSDRFLWSFYNDNVSSTLQGPAKYFSVCNATRRTLTDTVSRLTVIQSFYQVGNKPCCMANAKGIRESTYKWDPFST